MDIGKILSFVSPLAGAVTGEGIGKALPYVSPAYGMATGKGPFGGPLMQGMFGGAMGGLGGLGGMGNVFGQGGNQQPSNPNDPTMNPDTANGLGLSSPYLAQLLAKLLGH